jgi:hypothetical protein
MSLDALSAVVKTRVSKSKLSRTTNFHFNPLWPWKMLNHSWAKRDLLSWIIVLIKYFWTKFDLFFTIFLFLFKEWDHIKTLTRPGTLKKPPPSITTIYFWIMIKNNHYSLLFSYCIFFPCFSIHASISKLYFTFHRLEDRLSFHWS